MKGSSPIEQMPVIMLLVTIAVLFAISYLVTDASLKRTREVSFEIKSDSLDKQYLFWLGIIVPIGIFFYLEYFVFLSNEIGFNSTGFGTFFDESKLPLGVLALSPIFGVIVSNIHRTIQTEKQIQVTEVKNISDGFYAHNKYIIEELKFISGGKEDFELELHVKFPNSLYKNVYINSSVIDGALYEADKEFIENFDNKLISLSENIKKLTTYLNEKKEADGELKIYLVTFHLKNISDYYDELMSFLYISNRAGYLIKKWGEICRKFEDDEKENEKDGSSIYSFITDVSYFYNCVKVNNLLVYLLDYFHVTIEFIDKIADVLDFINQRESNKFRRIAIYELSDLKNDWNFKCQEISYDYREHRYEMQLAQERQGY